MNEKPILPLEELVEIGRCEEVDILKDNKEMRKIVAEIKKVMRKKNLTSLSAPGIGYNKRIFCIDYSDQEIKTYINPIISYAEGLELSREICSSIPGKEYIRLRNPLIDVYYTTPRGEIKTNRYKGLAAIVIQHEIDHLDGVTLDDIGLEIESDFDEASEEERTEIIDMYIDSLDVMQSELNKEIEGDDYLHAISERYKLIEAAAAGKIKITLIEEESNKEKETIVNED